MYIYVSEIPPEGLEFSKGKPTGSEITFEGRDLFPLKNVEMLWLEFHLDISGEDLVLKGNFGADVAFGCDRCGVEVLRNLEVSFSKVFGNQGMVKGAGDLELRREDLEITLYDGEGFLLEDVIYEQALLSMPLQNLCSDNCAGLCQNCGANRNNDACSCDRIEIDPRLEKLQRLREEME